MKILLLYPEPASGPKTRLSRTDLQLVGIADAVRGVLESVSTDPAIDVSEIVYSAITQASSEENNATAATDSIEQLYNDADFIINVTHSSTALGINCGKPMLHLSPTFSGSFACNDISLTASGRLQQADLVDQIQHLREPFMDNVPRSHALSPEMHYAAFTPLPVRIGDDFYRSSRKHALIFLSYPEHVRNEKTRDTDKAMIADILHSNENLKTITFVCESQRDVPLVQDVADDINRALGIAPKIVGLRRGVHHDMFSIMAKTDLVLFGGNSLYVDAIIRGIPVYTWRSEQQGAEPINTTFNHFLQDGTREQLAMQQRKQLDRLFDALYFDATLPNNKQCFNHVLLNLIAFVANRELTLSEQPNGNGTPWVITENNLDIQISTNADKVHKNRISTSVWQSRRELAKFRKAPEQYIKQQGEEAVTGFRYVKLR